VDLYFVESPGFNRRRDEHFGSDDEYRRFQLFLLQNPEAGEVIPGAHGARKVRWGEEARGVGKSGGIRIVYGYLAHHKVIHLITVYRKVRQEDLSAEERQMVAELMKVYERELVARKGRGTWPKAKK
jgi:mRNA-degrading endonuclease RelE of RelBE toxin-antitoxin system